MNEINNLKEFKELIKRYERITLEEIEEAFESVYLYGSSVQEMLTGYGSTTTCTLCKALNKDRMVGCSGCVYCCNTVLDYRCLHSSKETFDAIEDAEDAEELLEAYRNRANWMRQFARDNNIVIRIRR